VTDAEQPESPWAPRLELAGVLLIALTAVLTAWSAFESSKWSGVMAIRFNEAGAARTESVRNSNQANAQIAIDVNLFANYADAIAADETDLADFYRDRFPDRLATAVDAWLATDPLQSPDAPGSPFEMDEYQVEAQANAADLEARADRRSAQARDANQTSDNYTITSVFFATAILLSALSTKVGRQSLQVGMLVGAAVLLVGTAAVIATYPIEI
jgi:hypothetical protein